MSVSMEYSLYLERERDILPSLALGGEAINILLSILEAK
jgi:hypothetical protein